MRRHEDARSRRRDHGIRRFRRVTGPYRLFSLALLYLGQTQIPLVQNILSGISAAAAGLMIGTGLRLLWPHRRDPRVIALAALAFAGLAIAKFPLLLLLLALAPLSIAATMIFGARPR
jgi:chromate transport protein ChrA